jgi:hypothetical protein
MRQTGFSLTVLRRRAAISALAVLIAAPFLAACTSSGEGGSGGGFMSSVLSGGKNEKPDDYDADYFLRTGYCPPVQIRGGTESLTVYEKGHDGEAAFVRYQASIGNMARECRTTAGTLTVKLGIAGRVVAGPKGSAASLTLPIRVAVVKQFQAPLYSELVKVPVTVTEPDFAADYSQVVEQISVPIGPNDRDYIIYVGFDDAAPQKGKSKG